MQGDRGVPKDSEGQFSSYQQFFIFLFIFLLQQPNKACVALSLSGSSVWDV